MMYSQQEYDMVRRQTMQIEAEKRTLLRWALIAVTLLLALALVLMAWMYRRYSSADNEVREAESSAATAQTQLEQIKRELAEKTATLDRYTSQVARQTEVIRTITPKIYNRTGKDGEMAELAHAIYNQPGHVIELDAVPPNSVLRSYWIRIDGRPLKYTMIAGLLDGKWRLYSMLVKNQEDK
jgi:hypothetical protein